MAAEPDQIRSEIEATRTELAANVDQLADRTSPRRIVNRGWHKVTDRIHSLSNSVVGTPSSAAGSVKQMAGEARETVGDAATEAAQAVREAPQMVAQQTRGNPLAAGLIAFGAGLLAAAMIPESDAERRLSRKLADSDLAEQVREPLMQSASEVRQDLTQDVKETGAQLAESAKEHAASAVQETKETAQQARQQTAGSR